MVYSRDDVRKLSGVYSIHKLLGDVPLFLMSAPDPEPEVQVPAQKAAAAPVTEEMVAPVKIEAQIVEPVVPAKVEPTAAPEKEVERPAMKAPAPVSVRYVSSR